MTTIDVVPLQADNLSSEKAPKEEVNNDVLIDSEKNESTGSENNEKSRKRGRPAGAKDLKRRKTPVRRKKEISKESLGEIHTDASSSTATMPAAPAVAPAVTVVKDEVARVVATAHTPAPKEEIEKEAAARAIPPRAIPPREELTHYQRLRMQHLERQSAREAHWDGLITPMFRFPVY